MRRIIAIAALFGLIVIVPVADAEPACGNPTLSEGIDSDAVRDAAGRGQLFERIDVPGITDVNGGTQGAAFIDIDHDGDIDVFTNVGSQKRLMLNDGCSSFDLHPLTVEGEKPGTNYYPAFADFNGDGFYDIYLSASGYTATSSLWLSRGAFDSFTEVSAQMGVENLGAYVHGQVSIADVDRDGYLDMAVGANQIGTGGYASGRPLTRFYVYRPSSDGIYEHGRFDDLGGTETIPGFGGYDREVCDPSRDRSGTSLLLRDWDDDGDLDLINPSQNDMCCNTSWDHPCATGEWRFGVFAWANQLQEEGLMRFDRIEPGAGAAFDDDDLVLAEEGQMRYDETLQQYVPEQHAVGHMVVNTADIDNDGDLDVVTVGATDPEWHVHSDQMGGKVWINEGDWKFRAATDEVGLGALNWTYWDWGTHFDYVMPPHSLTQALACGSSNERPKCATLVSQDHMFMTAGTVFADFNNDGWLDMVFMDRHEISGAHGVLRHVLFMNDGDGTFTPVTTEVSGIDANSMNAEATDLDGDGLLDLYLIASAGNSTGPYPDPTAPADRNLDKVYWNSGALGGSENHWVRARLEGRGHAELLGATIRATDPMTGELLGRRDYFTGWSYKASIEPEAHFGLGEREAVDLAVTLPDGTTRAFEDVPIDALIALDVNTGAVRIIEVGSEPQPVEIRTERVYFDCHGSSRWGNVSVVEAGPIPWTTTAPTANLAGGGGCHYAEVGGVAADDLPAAGTFTGPIDSIGVSLHTTYAGAGRVVVQPFTMKVHLRIDGVDVLPPGTPIAVIPRAGSQVSDVIEFTIADVGFTRASDGGAHRLEISVDSPTGVTSAWAYGLVVQNSGVVFNPGEPIGPVYDAVNQP